MHNACNACMGLQEVITDTNNNTVITNNIIINK
jgi:hypothetical protein